MTIQSPPRYSVPRWNLLALNALLFATMATKSHTLVDYDHSLLCQRCQKLPPVDVYDEMAHAIHDNLEDLETCSCPFCTWLWNAILVDTTPETIDRYKKRISSSDWPIELTIQLRNGQSMAQLVHFEMNILMLPMYTSPGMFHSQSKCKPSFVVSPQTDKSGRGP